MPVEQLEAEQHAELVRDYVELKQEYAQLLSQLKWTHAVLAVLIEEEGGLVQLSKSVLESYDAENAALNVYDDADNGIYVIEVAEVEAQ